MKTRIQLTLSSLALLTSVFVNPCTAQAGFSVAGVGAFDYDISSYTAPGFTFTTTGGTGFGGGALLSLGFSIFDFELGGVYVGRSFTITTGGVGTQISGSALEVPLMFRFAPIHLISIGAGAYLGYGLGGTTSTTAGVTSSFSYGATGGIIALDYGLTAGVQLNFPIVPRLDILVDGRFQFGLANVVVNPAAGQSAYFRDLLVLAGLKLNI